MSVPLLSVRDLRTAFTTDSGEVLAVDGIGFHIDEREIFAVVGESGSGKTVLALSMLGLLRGTTGRVLSGEVRFRGEDLLKSEPDRLRRIRGDRISMIFQDPLTSLNPVHRVGDQITEALRAHRHIGKDEARSRAVELLRIVGMPGAEERVHDYPHQFSGGMRQRAMIAMAIALNPDLIIADEPTTALDVTIQAQVLDVLKRIRDEFGTAIMLITHDLGIVAAMADRVMVMYAGRNVEVAPADALFAGARMPYTWGLLDSTTRIDLPRTERMPQIPGAPPDLTNLPEGCRFHPRCGYSQAVCGEHEPESIQVAPLHEARCHFALIQGWKRGIPSDFAARTPGGPAL